MTGMQLARVTQGRVIVKTGAEGFIMASKFAREEMARRNAQDRRWQAARTLARADCAASLRLAYSMHADEAAADAAGRAAGLNSTGAKVGRYRCMRFHVAQRPGAAVRA